MWFVLSTIDVYLAAFACNAPTHATLCWVLWFMCIFVRAYERECVCLRGRFLYVVRSVSSSRQAPPQSNIQPFSESWHSITVTEVMLHTPAECGDWIDSCPFILYNWRVLLTWTHHYFYCHCCCCCFFLWESIPHFEEVMSPSSVSTYTSSCSFWPFVELRSSIFLQESLCFVCQACVRHDSYPVNDFTLFHWQLVATQW